MTRFESLSIQTILQKLKILDWSFIKSSTLLSIGIAIARVLGLAYSLILAQVFLPDDYGYIQYSITLAGVIAIGTQPFVQHVLARFVSVYKDDPQQLQEVLNAIWVILCALFIGTLLIVVPIALVTDRLNIGALVIFAGFTLFYSYFGLARGFLANYKLLAMHLGSNVLQLIAIIVAVRVMNSRSALLALMIYGLSYVLPWLLLQIFYPFPIRLQLALPKRERVVEVIRFSLPIWISHVGFMLYLAIDVLLLERFAGNTAVGVYSLSKTLSMVFSFIPMGLTILLMPKVAALPRHMHWKLLKNALIWSSVVNVVGLILYAITYNWFVQKMFGSNYTVATDVFMVLAVGNVIYGMYSIISSVLVGKDRAGLETISRIVCIVVAGVSGLILVPRYELAGAALVPLVGAAAALLTYGVMAAIRQKEKPQYANS